MMYIVNTIIDVYFYRSPVLMFLLLWVVVVDNFHLILVLVIWIPAKLMNITLMPTKDPLWIPVYGSLFS